MYGRKVVNLIENKQTNDVLLTFTILYDTREIDTEQLRQRLQSFGCPATRQKLDFGDYSAVCTMPDGSLFSLADKCVVERKMSLDELASCFTSDRKRFTHEFERAQNAGAKTYLLVEKGSWEKAYGGMYRSKMTANSMIASMTTWLARYDCQLVFCQPMTSGKLIHDILYREMKEHLLSLPTEDEHAQ